MWDVQLLCLTTTDFRFVIIGLVYNESILFVECSFYSFQTGFVFS